MSVTKYVVAGAAFEDIVPFAAVDNVVPAIAVDDVVTGTAEEQIRSWVTEAGLAVARYRVLPVDPRAKGPAVFTMVGKQDKR